MAAGRVGRAAGRVGREKAPGRWAEDRDRLLPSSSRRRSDDPQGDGRSSHGANVPRTMGLISVRRGGPAFRHSRSIAPQGRRPLVRPGAGRGRCGSPCRWPGRRAGGWRRRAVPAGAAGRSAEAVPGDRRRRSGVGDGRCWVPCRWLALAGGAGRSAEAVGGSAVAVLGASAVPVPCRCRASAVPVPVSALIPRPLLGSASSGASTVLESLKRPRIAPPMVDRSVD